MYGPLNQSSTPRLITTTLFLILILHIYIFFLPLPSLLPRYSSSNVPSMFKTHSLSFFLPLFSSFLPLPSSKIFHLITQLFSYPFSYSSSLFSVPSYIIFSHLPSSLLFLFPFSFVFILFTHLPPPYFSQT